MASRQNNGPLQTSSQVDEKHHSPEEPDVEIIKRRDDDVPQTHVDPENTTHKGRLSTVARAQFVPEDLAVPIIVFVALVAIAVRSFTITISPGRTSTLQADPVDKLHCHSVSNSWPKPGPGTGSNVKQPNV